MRRASDLRPIAAAIAVLCLVMLRYLSFNSGFPACSNLRSQVDTDNLIAQLRADKASLRKTLGQLSCKHTGLGPYGGFCLDAEKTRATGGNDILSVPLADHLYSFLAGYTVLDLGAGVGQYERRWADLAKSFTAGTGPTRVRAFDGAENIDEVTSGNVRWADLTERNLELDGGPADWVMSLEVAEHIPSNLEATFLSNLDRHARIGLIISWAVPGQGGHHHVNNRAADYVIPTVEALGWRFDLHATNETRAAVTGPVAPWFRETLFIFRRT